MDIYNLYTKVEGYRRRYMNTDFVILGICRNIEDFFFFPQEDREGFRVVIWDEKEWESNIQIC